MILYHYSRSKIERLDDRPAERYRDYFDNPSGLWLSLGKASRDGWFDKARRQTEGSSSWPCKNCIKYTTKFEVIDPSSERIYRITNESELYKFANCYGEHIPHRCQEPGTNLVRPHAGDECDLTRRHECFNCVGIHVDWTTVKAEFDGIEIIPHLEQQSYRHRESLYHWYRFDCAAMCIWRPTAHLEQVGQSTLNRELGIIRPECEDCTNTQSQS